jgi:hypothetical protein
VPRKHQARRCKAVKADGRPCGCYAMPGQEVCHWHGGRTQRQRRRAAERVAQAQALEVFERFSPDEDEPVDVVAALSRLISRTERFERYMARRVEVLAAREQAAGDPGQLHVELALYRQAIGEARKLLVAVAHLGLAEQATEAAGRLEQARAERIVAAFEAAVGLLDLDQRQHQLAPRAMAACLLSLTSEDDDD